MCDVVPGTCEHGRRRYPKEIEISRCHKSLANEEAKNGWLIPADPYILSINGQEISKEIKIVFLIRGTKITYQIPNDAFIFKSMAATTKFCKNEQKCAKCGQAGHEDQDCDN